MGEFPEKDESEDRSRRPTRAVVGSHREEEEIFGKAYDPRIIRRIWGFVRPYRKQMLISVAAVLVFTLTQLAIPLLAISILGAGAFEMSLLAVVRFLPWILFTLPAGVWIDRIRRRPILIGADVARALLLASIPIAFLGDWLTLVQVYVVAFLAGTQKPDGEWDEMSYTAVGFPRVFYLRYHGYKLYFPLLALARYRNLRRGNARRVEVGF